MSEMAFENVFYMENFECAGDEVLVESSPRGSPDMAARLAHDQQSSGAGGSSPSALREVIVIPEIPNSIHLQHAIQQVSSTVVEVAGDSSGHSSPAAADAQHTFIVAVNGKRLKVEPSSDNEMSDGWTETKTEPASDHESEGGNGVNYHVQYVTAEPQEIYAQGQQMETLRSYPVYGVATVATGVGGEPAPPTGGWGPNANTDYTAYGLVVAGDEAEAPASPATPGTARMPPATVQWLLDHYETAEGVSLPRSTLYAHYLRHCASHRLEPVNAASFGKLIRSVFVGLRTRRLGTRGNSKYHYYGIRAKPRADSGDDAAGDDSPAGPDKQQEESCGARAEAASPLAAAAAAHRQYMAAVRAPLPPPLHLTHLPDDIPRDALAALREHHREHGAQFLEAVAALDAGGVERARRAFWRGGALCRRTLARLAARADVCRWLRAADMQLYQAAVDLLLPDVLRPIPPALTQAIRNFAKSVEGAVLAGGRGAGGGAARAGAAAGAALAAALRRYTSLNHLAQAARAVLTNQHQIHQMVSDLNRVDFRVVREQAAWACACGSHAAAQRLEADFKATLSGGASLEQWASWLEGCVRAALGDSPRGDSPADDTQQDDAQRDDTQRSDSQRSENQRADTHRAETQRGESARGESQRGDLVSRARKLLLHWSFYSSLVIRELTLRSAASFGSFHLLRLLYDEYVAYLVERRVAAHLAAPPIAVMYLTHTATEPNEQEEEAEENSREGEDEEWQWEDDDDDSDDSPTDTKRHKLYYNKLPVY